MLALQRQAIESQYIKRQQDIEMPIGLILAYDRYVAGLYDELDAGLGSDFQPSMDTLPYDPRLLIRAESDPFARTEIRNQVFKLFEDAPDPVEIYRLLFGTDGSDPSDRP